MSDEYFTAETTALTIPKRGAKAIYAGDKPRKNADGTTSYSLRGPLLIMPGDIWHDDQALLEKVAKVLNDNAAIFFDSAKADAAPGDPTTVERLRALLRRAHDVMSRREPDGVSEADWDQLLQDIEKEIA